MVELKDSSVGKSPSAKCPFISGLCVSGVISVLLLCDISVNTCSQPENIFISIYFLDCCLCKAANLIMLL